MMLRENTKQVEDDWDTFELMMADLKSAPGISQATNYWKVYESDLVSHIRKHGMKDFRRQDHPVLSSFGARDGIDDFHIQLKGSKIWRSSKLSKIIHRGLVESFKNLMKIDLPYKLSRSSILENAFDAALMRGYRLGAKPLTEIEASLAGNPEGVFYVQDKPYLPSTIAYYLRYIYCSKFVDYSRVNTIVEVGPGSGKQVELIKKFHPEITFLLFDIPPQLYYCERYLSTIFPGDVVSYKETKDLQAGKLDLTSGKIYIMGPWHYDVVKARKIDLFWNSASFQEMEPEVVANYLKPINENAGSVYLREQMGGKHIAPRPGESGVLEPVTLRHYHENLPNFDLIDLSTSERLPGSTETLANSFWTRKIQ